jgi:hypothetical protein
MRASHQNGGRYGDARDELLFGRVHHGVVAVLQAVMTMELVVLLLTGRYLAALMVAGVLALPLLFRNMSLQIPAEMQLATVLFVFATLFLGEVLDYYERFWWWDAALHFSSGLLLGLFGFLLVYMMNENRTVDFHMRPGFVALFALLFAVAVGGLWEVVEFAMDQWFGTQMQKPTATDPSGLSDSMYDIVLDTAGAAIVSLYGWHYMRRTNGGWLRRFIRAHPQMFGAR